MSQGAPAALAPQGSRAGAETGSREKKRRIGDATTSIVAVNSLCLVPGKNLPLAAELHALGFLAEELGALPFVSKDTYALVKEYYAKTHGFKCDENSEHAKFFDAHVSLLRYSKQLRVLDLDSSFIEDHINELQPLISSTILRNAATLTNVPLQSWTLPILSALATCSNLTTFADVGLTSPGSAPGNAEGTLCRNPRVLTFLPFAAYNAAVVNVIECCPKLTSLDLGSSVFYDDDDEERQWLKDDTARTALRSGQVVASCGELLTRVWCCWCMQACLSGSCSATASRPRPRCWHFRRCSRSSLSNPATRP
jgi:hypothetical protein